MIVYCQILFLLGMNQLKYFLVLQPLLQPVAVSGIAFWLDVFSSWMQESPSVIQLGLLGSQLTPTVCSH